MKYGVCFSWWNSFSSTWLTAIHQAPSCPALTGTQVSAYLATWLKSGENTHIFVPFVRASAAKCTSGVRVMLRLAPMTARSFALYQSALSLTSVCSPHVSGEALGRSQYQS